MVNTVPIRSAEEALEILAKTRRGLIEEARGLAVKICEAEGTVHARRIAELMEEKIASSGVGSYWLGNVFHKSIFEWTGQWHQVDKYPDAKNFHGPIGIRIWRLK